jgi:hypothetical protein
MESLREGLKQLEQGDHGILHVLLGVSAHAVKVCSDDLHHSLMPLACLVHKGNKTHTHTHTHTHRGNFFTPTSIVVL